MSTPVNWGGRDIFRIYTEESVTKTIESLEEEGQESFIASNTLPTEMDEITQFTLTTAGVIFGGLVPNDAMFRFATLPEGWQKVAGTHSTQIFILDEKERIRAQVYFNAVSYNREASIDALPRYGTTIEKGTNENGSHPFVVGKVVDGKKVLYITEPYAFDCELTSENAAKKRARARAREWLDINYPDWHKPAAYWD